MSARFRNAALTLSLTLGLALVAIGSPGAAAEEATLPDHVGHATKIIGIAPSALFPTIIQIAPSDAFGWLNYSASNASIRFEEDIVKHMTCRGPSLFQLTGDLLMAPKVPSGSYATLCSLKPGEYDYEVVLSGSKPLLGKIVVSDKS